MGHIISCNFLLFFYSIYYYRRVTYRYSRGGGCNLFTFVYTFPYIIDLFLVILLNLS